MGKRKKGLKRDNPDRSKAFKALRNIDDYDRSMNFNMMNGAQVILNPIKRFLLKKVYVNPEYQSVMIRTAQKYSSIGE